MEVSCEGTFVPFSFLLWQLFYHQNGLDKVRSC